MRAASSVWMVAGTPPCSLSSMAVTPVSSRSASTCSALAATCAERAACSPPILRSALCLRCPRCMLSLCATRFVCQSRLAVCSPSALRSALGLRLPSSQLVHCATKRCSHATPPLPAGPLCESALRAALRKLQTRSPNWALQCAAQPPAVPRTPACLPAVRPGALRGAVHKLAPCTRRLRGTATGGRTPYRVAARRTEYAVHHTCRILWQNYMTSSTRTWTLQSDHYW